MVSSSKPLIVKTLPATIISTYMALPQVLHEAQPWILRLGVPRCAAAITSNAPVERSDPSGICNKVLCQILNESLIGIITDGESTAISGNVFAIRIPGRSTAAPSSRTRRHLPGSNDHPDLEPSKSQALKGGGLPDPSLPGCIKVLGLHKASGGGSRFYLSIQTTDKPYGTLNTFNLLSQPQLAKIPSSYIDQPQPTTNSV